MATSEFFSVTARRLTPPRVQTVSPLPQKVPGNSDPANGLHPHLLAKTNAIIIYYIILWENMIEYIVIKNKIGTRRSPAF